MPRVYLIIFSIFKILIVGLLSDFLARFQGPNSPNLPINLENHLALLLPRVRHVIDVAKIFGLICSPINKL